LQIYSGAKDDQEEEEQQQQQDQQEEKVNQLSAYVRPSVCLFDKRKEQQQKP